MNEVRKGKKEERIEERKAYVCDWTELNQSSGVKSYRYFVEKE